MKFYACLAALLMATPAVAATPALVAPVNVPLTSPYGERMDNQVHKLTHHSGQDYAAKAGTQIVAAAAGKVIFSGWYGNYGQSVIVDHGNGLTTMYGHADTLLVKQGDAVKQGQAIATVGQSGLSSSQTHVHFEVRRGGTPVNPARYLKK
ncbi:MAG: peptidase [Cyanobacteria bacterium RYN_339]|nr:peptidase [Cyanobacteria bacterium RYN_339]